MTAASRGNAELVRILLENSNATVNYRTEEGCTALSFAMEVINCGGDLVVPILLQHGATVPTDASCVLLLNSCLYPFPEFVRQLLECGANVESTNDSVGALTSPNCASTQTLTFVNLCYTHPGKRKIVSLEPNYVLLLPQKQDVMERREPPVWQYMPPRPATNSWGVHLPCIVCSSTRQHTRVSE